MRKIKRAGFIISLIILFLSGCALKENETQLTRRILYSLCRGNQSVEKLIDWQVLKALEVDVGKAYSSLVTERERQYYKKAFFYNFSMSFKSAGGTTSVFHNWRIIQTDGNNTIVACDTPSGKTLLLTLSLKYGKQKLVAIQWQGVRVP